MGKGEERGREEKGEVGLWERGGKGKGERRGEKRCVCTYLGLVEESLIKEGVLRSTSRRQP